MSTQLTKKNSKKQCGPTQWIICPHVILKYKKYIHNNSTLTPDSFKKKCYVLKIWVL